MPNDLSAEQKTTLDNLLKEINRIRTDFNRSSTFELSVLRHEGRKNEIKLALNRRAQNGGSAERIKNITVAVDEETVSVRCGAKDFSCNLSEPEKAARQVNSLARERKNAETPRRSLFCAP